MRIYGHEQFGSELFVRVGSVKELERCINMIPCFNLKKKGMDMAIFCRDCDVVGALFVESSLDVVYGINLGMSYLIAPLNTEHDKLKEWQGILQDYVADSRMLLEIYGEEKEILAALKMRLDGVVFSSAIKSLDFNQTNP